MKITIKKTEAMVVSKKNSPKGNVAIDGQHIEHVTSHT